MKTKTSRQRKLQPKIRRVKKGHYILIKGTIHQEDIMTIDICTKQQCTQLHKTNTTGHKGIY
jgi:hypothetical protein